MILLAILSFLLGTVLGLRFRVFVLIPMTAVASLLVLTIGVAVGAASWPILGAVVLVAALSQIGFLCGLSMRTVVSGRDLFERGRLASGRETGARFTPSAAWPCPPAASGGRAPAECSPGSAAVVPPI